MEDQKLKKKIPHVFDKRFFRRRQGSGLMLALVIILVASALIAVLFELAVGFSAIEVNQRYTYSDQVLAGTYIEKAKGLIAARIVKDGAALHPLPIDDWNARPHIESLEALQVFLDRTNPGNDPLSVDEKAGKGGRRVTMRVYDLTYGGTWVPNTVDATVRAQLPTPLTLLDVATATNQTLTSVGSVYALDVKSPPNNAALSRPDLKDIGAYLVRVELFDSNNHRLRLTEEAFYQLASDNIGVITQ